MIGGHWSPNVRSSRTDAVAAGRFAGGDAVEVRSGPHPCGSMVKVGAAPFGTAWHVLVEFTHAAGEVARASPADLECSLTDGPVSTQDLGVPVAKSKVGHNSALPFEGS